MESAAIIRDQPGIVVREVRLCSHPSSEYMATAVQVQVSSGHARISFSGYWHDAGIAMEHDELAQVRDAIDQALAAEIPAEAEAIR